MLDLAQPRFDLFITSDQSLTYQQNLAGRKIAIIQLSSKLRRVIAAADAIRAEVVAIQPGQFREVDIP